MYNETGQVVTCDKSDGLICMHSASQAVCQDYAIRLYCCQNLTDIVCPTSPLPSTEVSQNVVSQSQANANTVPPCGSAVPL